MTPCCGLGVQKPTQALKSVKGPSNTFDSNPKWSRTLPSLIYFYGIFIETHLHKKNNNNKVDIWHPAVGLRCRNTLRHLSQLKARAILLLKPQVVKNIVVLNIFFMAFYRDTPSTKKNTNSKVDIWHPAVDLRSRNPPRHLSQLKARAIPLI